MDKYNIDFSLQVKEKNLSRLTNQLWKLLPMRENGENWEQHLTTITEEIAGLVKLYNQELDGLILLSKLEGLSSQTCQDFMVYRKTIFRCIGLLSQVLKNG